MVARIAIVRTRPVSDNDGGDVMNRHVIARLRAIPGVEIDDVLVERQGVLPSLVKLAASPPELTRYDSAANRVRLRAAAATADWVVFLHEATFPLLPALDGLAARALFVSHNAPSRIAATDPSRWARALAPIAHRFERRWFASDRVSLTVISVGDAEWLAAHGIDRGMEVVPPGPPPEIPLAPDATFGDDLVMTGSYGWWRKRRDLRRMAAEAQGRAVILTGDALALDVLGPAGRRFAEDFDWGDAIRFGLLSDRFEGGFKLKSLEYVARNCVVLGYIDMAAEFRGLPHAERFVRRIESLAEVPDIVAALRDDPAAVGQFRTFRAACLDRYRWDRCLAPLDTLIAVAVPASAPAVSRAG